ncbi:MAG: LON peptidase substrate-binding domain-containing protein, partial [Campylobacter hyointestinalis]
MQIKSSKTFPANLPVIVEDELFLYPFMITPLFLNDEQNLKALDVALQEGSQILVVSSKPQNETIRDFDACYNAGVIGSVMRKVPLPDGRVKILFQGNLKGKITERVSVDPMIATVDVIDVQRPSSQKVDALLSVLREKVKSLSLLNHFFPPDLLKTIDESMEATRVCDLILSSLRLKKSMAYTLFIEENLENRILKIVDYVIEEIEAYKLQKEIKTKVHSKIDKVNKEYFLKEQLKEIQKELGGDSSKEEEISEYRDKLEAKKPCMGEDAYKEIKKQIDRLSRMHPDGSEFSMTSGYLDWALDVPFGNLVKKKLGVNDVETQLGSDHYGLEKPKRRIVEYFGLRELLELRGLASKTNNGVILCFVGPPGVGKTSLANSISKALKRELVRIALGGLEDVNELRGHRRTYIGAM